jgi:hypothetical protein
MCIDPLAEKYQYQTTYSFCENRVIDWREIEGLEGTPTQQWNGAFRGMILQLAGTWDKFSAKVSATISTVTHLSPFTTVERSTSVTVPGTNFSSFLKSAEQNNGTPTTSLFKPAKVESKTEVKTGTTLKAKVGVLDVTSEVGATKNLENSQTTVDTKIVVGSGSTGVYVANSNDVQTKENKTSAGVQVEAETPKVNNTTIKVSAKIYIGDE